MANVTLRNVRKTYPGGVDAIKGIDFERQADYHAGLGRVL